MNIQITVQISAELQKSLDRLGTFGFIEAAADGAYKFLIDYHSEMNWRGPDWIPGPNSGEFAQNVVKGWQPPEIAGDTARIVNTFGLLAWKVTGGTITPKQAQALTIPLTTAAKGSSAPNFPGILFRTGNALSIQLSRGVGGAIVPQYALAKSVTQAPWPGAMPTNEEIAEAASQAVMAALELPAAA